MTKVNTKLRLEFVEQLEAVKSFADVLDLIRFAPADDIARHKPHLALGAFINYQIVPSDATNRELDAYLHVLSVLDWLTLEQRQRIEAEVLKAKK